MSTLRDVLRFKQCYSGEGIYNSEGRGGGGSYGIWPLEAHDHNSIGVPTLRFASPIPCELFFYLLLTKSERLDA